MAAAGVGDSGQHEGEAVAVETGGEVAEVDWLPVGERGGRTQQPQLAAAATDRPGAQCGVDVGPGDLRPEPLAVDVAEQADQPGTPQLGNQSPALASSRTAASAE